MNVVKYCLAGLAIFVLAGCVTTQPVKDVLADPQRHLVTNFSEAKLSDSVRSALGIKMPGNVKRQVRIDSVMTNVEGDKEQSFEKQSTYYVLDNGLVRDMVQTGNNGILSSSEFALNYHGIFPLIYQSLSHSATNTYSPTYTKAISKLDKGMSDPKETTEYVFEYALAPEVQLVNFNSQKTVCKTGKWFAANTLHAALPGMALPVECEYFGTNGQTFIKIQTVFFKDLGISIPRESTSSVRKRTWKIRDVKL